MKLKKTIKVIAVGSLLSVMGFVAPVAFDGLSDSNTFGSSAYAQAKKKVTRRLPGIKESTLKKLGQIQNFIAPDLEKKPDAEPDLAAALKATQKLDKLCKKKCNDPEKSQVYRFYGYIYYSMDNYKKAIESYKKLVALAPEVAIALELESYNILMQLTFAQEDYKDSLMWMDKWIDLSTLVTAEKYYSRGTIHYSIGDNSAALKDVLRAIKMTESKGKTGKEEWYSLARALHLGKEDYKAALAVLEKLVRHYPKKSYWDQISIVHGTMGNEDKQRNALEALYVMDNSLRSQQIMNLAYMFMGSEAPYKGAKILEKGMKDKVVKESTKNLKALAAAWAAAREPKKAILVYGKAAKQAIADAAATTNKKHKNLAGGMYAQMVSLYLNLDDSKSAIKIGKKALQAGNLKSEGSVHVNIGIAYADLHQYKSAMGAFEKAMNDKKVRRFAENWYKHSKQEHRRQQRLAEL